MFLYGNNSENYMYWDRTMSEMETDELCGTVRYILSNGNSSYVVTVFEQWDSLRRHPLVSKSFGNGVSAEDFLLKVLCNPTFYKIQYS